MVCQLVMRHMSGRVGWAACALLVLFASQSRGEIILTVDDGQIQPGGTTRINVYIESDEPLGDSFGIANFDFDLETISSAGRLEFTPDQPRDYLTDLEYIFEGDSLAVADSIDVGTVGGVPPGTNYFGGDSTASFANLATPLTSRKLLASLEITALTILPANPGDQFRVVFDAASSSFLDVNFVDEIAINLGASKLSGTITVVPEPTTLGLLVAVSCGGALFRRRRQGRTSG